MGKHGESAQLPNGLLPNGLLPGEAESVVRKLDPERWSKAEDRIAELIACIQPNPPSEERRNAVATYVSGLITKCFPCEPSLFQVFTFGSVPLKTYLPDGDIDLSIFSSSQDLKDTWAHQVRDMLESEEKHEDAKFHFRVKEVQYIQAEVKIIKCLVGNIVVDISFNQLGGLCTLCFLEEVDNLINQSHLFKRSIILIKAWCYYESRILGAHHGLISTYALETLVLYIFHVFNNNFAGPLEVLYRFLEFFSKFDWDNFCVSLRGPVHISSLPDVTADLPRKDGGDLLLSKGFLDACNYVYSVYPIGQENQGQPFISKHFNVIDPLRVNNNLGRSVSRGNFFRIRSAFAFGAKKLARLLDNDFPKEDILFEINEFFLNTWERHGSGHRPDARRDDLRWLRSSNAESLQRSENLRSNSTGKKSESISVHESHSESAHGPRGVSSQHLNHISESASRRSDRRSDTLTISRTPSQKNHVNVDHLRVADNNRRETNLKQATSIDKDQRSSRADGLVNDIQGRFLFARTHSSPELTDAYSEGSSQGRFNRGPDGGKNQTTSARLDNSRRKILETDGTSLDISSSADVSALVGHSSIQQDVTTDSDSLNSYHDDGIRLGVRGESFASVSGSQGLHHEEQDFVNMMSSSQAHAYNGQVHMPLNLSSGHLPLNLIPMGYAQRNIPGMIPSNIPFESPWLTNISFPPGLVSPSLAHYFPDISLGINLEDSIEPSEQNLGSKDANLVEVNGEFWREQERELTGGFDLGNGDVQSLQSDDQQQSTSTSYGFAPSSREGNSSTYPRVHQKSARENRGSSREDKLNAIQHQGGRENEVYMDDRSGSLRSLRATLSSSRSKTSSESSWEGISTKSSMSTREKRGRKTGPGAFPSSTYGKGKSLSENSSAQADDDSMDLNLSSSIGHELMERSAGPHPVDSGHVPTHQLPGFEPAQTGGTDSMIPILLGPGSRERPMDNSRVYAFYPTGPPVPILLFPHMPSDGGSSDASTSHFSVEEVLDNNDTGQNFDSSEGLDHPEALNTSVSVGPSVPVEPSEHKSDILNSDFASHWQNLQFGRLCQNSHCPTPMLYPSPNVLSPICLPGHFPWDGAGRPLSANTNAFSYGPHLVPVSPVQPISNGPASIYHVDEMPIYRSGGTGTYLPSPVSARERHSSNTRRGNYSYDRVDHHADREGNWNVASKSKPSRNHNRNQSEKSNSRPDRVAAGDGQSERPWGSYRHGSFSSYHSQNSPIRTTTTQGGPANVGYGMYPLPAMNPTILSSNGPTLPRVMMFYPYGHNSAYASSSEQLEFGSIGTVGFSGMNDASQLNEGSHSSSIMEEQRFHGTPASQSPPDQPSSPHLRR
ncbi:uncharacterized protein LOC115678037 isoform X2 [Syzygium oleosum]|uniref:uncharacterized protein LOC115678037 isoform X2 n=1 Tax=Syzygium oleosum TaxID=219896 RepID=UPI0024BBDB98|nr:uncharacterized protein LOC115678037 isoform X2 [Syzygium oleosum]